METTPCGFKTVLETIAAEKAPGPSATFSVLHIVIAMQTISEESPGRMRLARRLGIGEGAARTIIERLRAKGLMIVSKKGCALTEQGNHLWREYRSVFPRSAPLGMNELTKSLHNYAILVSRSKSEVGSGIIQRDAAVKAGARGATTMMFRKGRLRIPGVSDDISRDYPAVSKEIVELLQPRENNLIIVGSGDSAKEAEYGTLAAALTLC